MLFLEDGECVPAVFFTESEAPLERVPRVPGNPSILRKAMQKSEFLTNTSLNFDNFMNAEFRNPSIEFSIGATV